MKTPTKPTAPLSMKTGIELIAQERARQVSQEEWTERHDDAHTEGELAEAACCYANPKHSPGFLARWWPWDREFWKPAPDNRVRELVKAGALIAAEIDRLNRATK